MLTFSQQKAYTNSMSKSQPNGRAVSAVPAIPAIPAESPKDLEKHISEIEVGSSISVSNDPMISLLRKMNGIMEDVQYIQKDKHNKHFDYWFLSEAAIKKHMHKAMVKHRVLFMPLNVSTVQRITGLGKTEKETLTQVRVLYRFVDIDTGAYIEGESEGTGIDNADKGFYKSLTGALKYILTSHFLIETGDDPEKDESLPEKPELQAKPPRVESKPYIKPATTPVVTPLVPELVIDEDSAESSEFVCEQCKKGVGKVQVNGQEISIEKLVDNAKKKYNRVLCAICSRLAGDAAKKAANRPVNSTVVQ